MRMETKDSRPAFPWYKERLQTKYLKASTNKLFSVSSCWRFANMSLDDFGDCSSFVPGAQSGLSPLIFQDTPQHTSRQKPRKSVSKEHACFSKQMIQKQIRRDYVASLEDELKRHPLATYPHYKDHMTPELFDQVVSILDPEICINSTGAPPAPPGDHAEEEGEANCREPSREEVDQPKQETSANKISPDVQSPSPRNRYTLQVNVYGLKRGQAVSDNQLSSHKDMKELPGCSGNGSRLRMRRHPDGVRSSHCSSSKWKNDILSRRTGRTNELKKVQNKGFDGC
ncbi:putative protein FAM47C [Embiotoca jacksoni]|uniref:putative protein FAM47C n=1 Tax=Embiotoca jacksoni TaxID=100190 RepID=UPI003704A15C